MRRLKSGKSWIVLLLCVCINVAGRSLASALNLPFWLDAIGTIVVAIKIGPVGGAVCGMLLNLVTSSGDPLAFPYMAVSAGVGISVGLLYPREKVTNLKIVTTSVLTGLIAALISTPINLIIYHGNTGNAWGDGFMNMIARDVHVPLITSFLGECFVDIPDKALSFFLALGIIRLGKKIDKIYIKKTAAAVLVLVLLSPMFLYMRAEAADFGAEYAGTVYDSDTGLDSVEVNAIAQTGDGYVWAGSYAGLYRYDGYKFKLVNLDERIKNVMVLKVDSNGYLWIGTNDNGLACYDYRTGEVDFFTTAEGLSSNVIRDVAEDCQGDIYVATATQLCRIDSERQVNAYQGVSCFGIRKLAASGDTVCAIRTDGSIVVFSNSRMIYVLGGDYTSIAAETEGNYILGGSKNTTGMLNLSSGSTDVITGHYFDELSSFNDILYSKDFKGAFVCCENGLGFLSDRGSMTPLTTNDFGSSVVDVMVDYQGNVWFASNKQGVKKFSWNPFEDIFAKADIDESVVYSCMVKDGLLYAGTGSGLITIDLKTYYSVPIPNPAYFKNVRIRDIMSDSKGNIWLSVFGGAGLVEMHPDNTLEFFNKETAGTEGEDFILAKELSDGRILAVSNSGLNFIKDEKLEKTLGEHEGITARVLCATEAEDGRIYVGTDGSGIYVLHNDEIVQTIGEEEGLETSVVTKIVPCKGGFIYVTSNALYYDNTERIRRLYHFPYSNNYDVFIDDNGKAWVLSSGGIYVLQEKDLLKDESYNYLLLNRNRGMYTAITSEAGYCLDGDKLYIPCTDGVRRISITNYDSFNNEYDIRIADLIAGDEVIGPRNGVYNIPAISGRIQFDVAVLNYSLSDPILHIYLKGAEDEGVICTQKNMQNLTFTNLPSGDYELHVEVMDTSGNNLLREEVFPVHKESQIFERSYFKAYMLLVGMLLVMYIGWLISDILQRFGSIKILEQEATKDPLTGLLNKRGAKESLEPLCRKGRGMLAILDLDNFKPVNDLYGHDMGDRILIELSNILREHSGSEDVLCRTGGDEFVAFFDGMDVSELQKRAALFNAEIMENAKKHLGEAMPIPIGLSIGVVEVKGPEEDCSYDEYLRKADKALYAVKNAGKHDFLLYDEERMEKESLDNQGIIPGFERIRTVLGERGGHESAYRADGDRMQAVFHIMSRMKRHGLADAVLLKFAILGNEENKTTTEIVESFADFLKQNLTATDVVSVGGLRRVMAMLVGKSEDEGELIGNEIVKKWEANPENSKYSVTFEKEML